MSFSASLSGLNANQQKLSVIGNNLANINTVGFKASTVAVHGPGQPDGRRLERQPDAGRPRRDDRRHLAQLHAGRHREHRRRRPTSPSRAAASSSSAAAATTARTPAPATSRSTPTAAGDGRRPAGAGLHRRSTRSPATSSRPGQPTDIVVPPGVLRAPGADDHVRHGVEPRTPAAAVGDTFTASVQIYDALGAAHVATITYTKTGPGAWSYDVTVPGAEVTGGTPGTPFSIATGNVDLQRRPAS